MKRTLCLCAALLLAMAAFAAAEPVLPPDALRLEERSFGTIRQISLEIPDTGERMALLLDGDDNALALVTTVPGTPPATENGDASAAARDACPGAIVLREDGDRLILAARDWFGTLELRSGRVVSRELKAGCYVNGDGLLSLDGALCAIRLLRPEAEITGIEFDAGDREYEGEALLDGELYEFEIDAATGRLLEWERD